MPRLLHGFRSLVVFACVACHQALALRQTRGHAAIESVPSPRAPDGFKQRMVRLARRLDLAHQLRDLVLESLPMRYYHVAASTLAGLTIWDIAVSPRGIVDVADVDIVKEIRLTLTSRKHCIHFLPGRELIVANVAPLSQRHHIVQAELFDVRSGDMKLSLPRVEALAVSSSGDLVVGQSAVDSRGHGAVARRRGISVWNATSERSTPVAWGQAARFCVAAAFSPGGDRVAALVDERHDDLEVDVRCVLRIWDSRSGEELCSVELPPRDAVYIVGEPGKFAFDGETVAICRGNIRRSFVYRVDSLGQSCELFDEHHNGHCEDVWLTGKLQLQIDGTHAVVKRVDTAEVKPLHEVSMPIPDAEVLHSFGALAGDGKSVLLGALVGQSVFSYMYFLWKLLDDRRLWTVNSSLVWSKPIFSPDGQVVVGFSVAGRSVMLMDTTSGRAIHFPPLPDAQLLDLDIALGCPRRWWGAGACNRT